MDHSINIHKDVITSELCDELISLHKKEIKNTEKGTVIFDQYNDYKNNVECYDLNLNDYPEHDEKVFHVVEGIIDSCLLYTSPSPRDGLLSRMPSSA